MLAKFIAYSLPSKILYWCIVRVACAIEDDEFPGDITALEMTQFLSGDGE